MKTHLGLSIAFIIVLVLNACSQTTAGLPTGSAYLPTTGTTTAVPIQTPLPGSINSGLFNTSTSSDPQPQVQPGYAQQPYAQSALACLTTQSPYSYYGQGATLLSGSSNPGCVAPQSAPYGQDIFMQQALSSLGGMQNCFNAVVAVQPTSADPAALAIHFQGAKMALVRCYRQVLRGQIAVAQWASAPTGQFNQVDANLYYMLSGFSQQQQYQQAF
ncbi:MAG: hypothetical protein HYZ71_15895 [Deltaproteobacteria bacterium]|nr:hypothetical protein [Deltaproteobacteria bacterium]